MLRYIISFALLVACASFVPAQTPPPCQITGHIAGIGNQVVIFLYTWQGQQRRDTVRAHNDRFTYRAHLSDDSRLMLKLVPGKITSLWYEPGSVTITGNLAEPTQLRVVGTPENMLSTQFKGQTEWKLERRVKLHPDSLAALTALLSQATRSFIAAHPRSRTSAALLYEQAKYFNDQPVAVYEQLLRQLAPNVRASAQGQDVSRRLAVLRQQPQVGQPLPPFSMPDTAGVAVSLAHFRGQYVLLDFWGHW